MYLKKFGLVLFLIFSLFPIQKIHAQTTNTGFVSGNIWYSKDPFEEGDKIKIYTFIFNPDSRELSGTVIFFDKTTLLGKKSFVIPGKGADDISIDWTVTTGDHTIFGKIENAKFLISKDKYEEVYLAENETEKSSRTVSKKIIPKTNDNSINSITSSVSDIAKTIGEKTPAFITEPVISSTNKLDEIRLDLKNSSEAKKVEIQNDIKKLENTKVALEPKSATSTLVKPFKYAEVFFLTIFSYLLSNKILFYGILILIIFFILRYIWKKIF
ncbi:MAG: hypothetical protein WCS86_00920 [Candidatus Paceibacterota bacterium]